MTAMTFWGIYIVVYCLLMVLFISAISQAHSFIETELDRSADEMMIATAIALILWPITLVLASIPVIRWHINKRRQG